MIRAARRGSVRDLSGSCVSLCPCDDGNSCERGYKYEEIGRDAGRRCTRDAIVITRSTVVITARATLGIELYHRVFGEVPTIESCAGRA